MLAAITKRSHAWPDSGKKGMDDDADVVEAVGELARALDGDHSGAVQALPHHNVPSLQHGSVSNLSDVGMPVAVINLSKLSCRSATALSYALVEPPSTAAAAAAGDAASDCLGNDASTGHKAFPKRQHSRTTNYGLQRKQPSLACVPERQLENPGASHIHLRIDEEAENERTQNRSSLPDYAKISSLPDYASATAGISGGTDGTDGLMDSESAAPAALPTGPACCAATSMPRREVSMASLHSLRQGHTHQHHNHHHHQQQHHHHHQCHQHHHQHQQQMIHMQQTSSTALRRMTQADGAGQARPHRVSFFIDMSDSTTASGPTLGQAVNKDSAAACAVM